MRAWIAVVIAAVALLVAALSLAERFYSRFYPEVEAQKRHLRKAGYVLGWVWDLGLLAIDVSCFVWVARLPRSTVDRSDVVVISLMATGLFAVFLLVIARRFGLWLFGLMIRRADLSRSHARATEAILHEVARQRDALEVIASHSGFPPELRRSLRESLDGGPEREPRKLSEAEGHAPDR
jgi:hypothetical protein